MNRAKLDKLRIELARLRQGRHKAATLERLATKLGRKKAGKRGKEPVWVHPDLPVYPLAIPHHGGKDLSPGTQRNVLDILEGDITAWDELLPDDEVGDLDGEDEENGEAE